MKSYSSISQSVVKHRSLLSTTLAFIFVFGLVDSSFGQIYTPGSLAGQNGWSGGTFPTFTNNLPGMEAITTADAHTGLQSWRYSDGYNSPGAGTPFSPGLAQAASDSSNIDTFTATVWFKPVSLTGDDSGVAIEFGNPTGSDRSAGTLYLSNAIGGSLTLTMADETGGTVTVASGLDAALWHKLEITGVFAPGTSNDLLTVSLDGGSPSSYGSWAELYRQDNSLAQEASNRLKFREFNNANNNVTPYASRGFYFDDISYSSYDSTDELGTIETFTTSFENAAVPEPSTWVMLGLGAFGLLLLRRKRKVDI